MNAPDRVFQPLLNTRGSILLLVLGLLVIVGLLTVEVFRRMENSNQRSNVVVARSQDDILLSAFDTELQNPVSCTRMLHKTVLSPGQAAPVKVNISSHVVAQQIVVTLDKDPDMSMPMKAEAGASLFRYPARLDVNLGTPHNNGLSLFVWVDASKHVVSCFGLNSAGALCNAIGGYLPVDVKNEEATPKCTRTPLTVIGSNPTEIRVGSCRYGGVYDGVASCKSRYGRQFDAVTINDSESPLKEPARFVCVKCD